MDEFPHAIPKICSSTPETDRGPRDLVVEIVCKHINALLEKPDFQTVLEETVGFAADITRLKAHGGSFEKYQCYKCPNCGNRWEAALSPKTTYYYIRCGNSRSSLGQYVVTADCGDI
jgi:speckle-type POZ protein